MSSLNIIHYLLKILDDILVDWRRTKVSILKKRVVPEELNIRHIDIKDSKTGQKTINLLVSVNKTIQWLLEVDMSLSRINLTRLT